MAGIAFDRYDRENPRVWDSFRLLAAQVKARGFTHYSANGLFEVMRWHTSVEGDDQFKVNNNYRPDYARKLEAENADFAGFFRVRELKAPRVTD